MKNTNNIRIFLCHSDKDHNFVHKLAKDLTNKGINVWFDEWEMKVGDSLSKKIQAGIIDSSWLAVILSPDSVKSPWVERELSTGLDIELKRQDVFVLPILFRPCEMPPFLRDKVYADFSQDYNHGLDNLLKAISDKCKIIFESPKEELQKYEIIDEIGRSSSSIVYRARNVLLDREEALKVLKSNYADHPLALLIFH
jgi:hypothetical protein